MATSAPTQRVVALSQIHPYWWPGHSLEWWTREDCDGSAVAFVERVGYRILASGVEGLSVPGGHAATHIIRINDGDAVEDYLACLVDGEEGADAQV